MMGTEARQPVTQPGGAVVPLADLPRREGPADAPAVIVVIDHPDRGPDTAAVDGDAHLGTSAFVDEARADALRAAARRPQVTIAGERYALPCDDSSALREFVITLYLVRGWEGVHNVRDQLAKMVNLKLHPQHPPAEQMPPERYLLLREQLAQAGVADVQRWAFACQDAVRILGATVLDLAAALEAQAVQAAQATLDRSVERVLRETSSYFQWKDRAAAIGALRGLESPPLQRGAGLNDLRTRIGRLRPAAVALKEGRLRVAALESLQKGIGRMAIVPQAALSALDTLAAVREATVRREAEFSALLLDQAPPRPVLFRLDLETLSKDPSDLELGRLVFARLQRTWEATERLTARFARTRPARDADPRRVYAGAVPEALIAEASTESVWAFPKLMQAAAAQMPADQRLMIDRLLEELDAARARHARAELKSGILSGIGLAGLALALTVLCPPAGLALDVALSAPDVYTTAEEYRKEGDEAVSDLDPRESLSDAGQSVWPVVFAVAATLMTAA